MNTNSLTGRTSARRLPMDDGRLLTVPFVKTATAIMANRTSSCRSVRWEFLSRTLGEDSCDDATNPWDRNSRRFSGRPRTPQTNLFSLHGLRFSIAAHTLNRHTIFHPAYRILSIGACRIGGLRVEAGTGFQAKLTQMSGKPYNEYAPDTIH